jgi:hypothetical protein
MNMNALSIPTKELSEMSALNFKQKNTIKNLYKPSSKIISKTSASYARNSTIVATRSKPRWKQSFPQRIL